MKRWLTRVGKRALLVGALLTVAGFAAAKILIKALEIQGVEAETSIEVPLIFGLILGGSGLVLVIVFELIGAAWQALRGRKPEVME